MVYGKEKSGRELSICHALSKTSSAKNDPCNHTEELFSSLPLVPI